MSFFQATKCFTSNNKLFHEEKHMFYHNTNPRNITAILTNKIDDLHKIAKALLTYETLTGEDISNIINKNEYPPNKEDLKVEDESSDSALGSIGLKPKIVH